MGEANLKIETVKDALRRFPTLPNRTLARYILDTNGLLFDNNLENIRESVRYYRGKHGGKSLAKLRTREFIRQEPILLPKTWRKVKTPYKLPAGLWGVFSDLHVPYHETMPIEQAVSYCQSKKITGVLFNGDFQDCASLGIWFLAKRDFNREVEATIDTLDWFRQQFQKAKFVYKPGNHEYRLPRYYVSKAPELALSPLAAMETILGFEERHIEFLDYFQIIMAGDLPIIHGHEYPNISKAVNAARGLYLRTKTYAACSHCHSTSMHTPKNIKGELLTTWSFGCLCDLNPDYNPFGDTNWGFALINVEKNGDFEVENRRILPSGKVV